jgi:hypothetical protein
MNARARLTRASSATTSCVEFRTTDAAIVPEIDALLDTECDRIRPA